MKFFFCLGLVVLAIAKASKYFLPIAGKIQESCLQYWC